MIDEYKLGYLTTRSITHWLEETVGFRLHEAEAKIILNRYDKDGDYCINLGEFIEEVSPVIVPEEEEEEDMENAMEGEGDEVMDDGDEQRISGR